MRLNKIEKRDWEKYWNNEKTPVDFMRVVHKPRQRYNPIYHVMAEEVARFGGSVLDVGCATCIAYDYLKPLGVKYVGVDFTEKFVTRARELYPGISVYNASALDLPFNDRSFTSIYCRAVLAHMHPDEYLIALREMVRVADRQVVIGWWRSPGEKRRIGFDGKVYANRYSKREVVSFIKNLKRFKELKVINIGVHRKESVYVIILN